MAQEAYSRAKKAMDLATEMRLARLIMQDAQQLEEKAKEQGVSAYLLKPVHRERPNERFLRNTLNSVEFANRRADEEEMWRLWDQQRKRSNNRKRSTREGMHRSRHRSASPPSLKEDRIDKRQKHTDPESTGPRTHVRPPEWSASPPPGGWDDSELDAFLSQHRARGRGAVGSRKDETGPFLPQAEANSPLHDDEGSGGIVNSQAPKGPFIPLWLARQLASNTALCLKEGSTSVLGGNEDGAKRKAKKRKKEKKEKKKRMKKMKKHKAKNGAKRKSRSENEKSERQKKRDSRRD